MAEGRVSHVVQERTGGGDGRNGMRTILRDAICHSPDGALCQVPGYAADFERMSQAGTHGIVLFERKDVSLILEAANRRAENHPAEVLLELGAISVQMIRGCGSTADKKARPFHHK